MDQSHGTRAGYHYPPFPASRPQEIAPQLAPAFPPTAPYPSDGVHPGYSTGWPEPTTATFGSDSAGSWTVGNNYLQETIHSGGTSRNPGGNFAVSSRDARWLQSSPRNRLKALLIGVNYMYSPSNPNTGTRFPVLPGSHGDVDVMYEFLTMQRGWPREAFTLLKDDPRLNPWYQPTRENIIREIGNLVKDAREGDHLFLHYSGHGSQIPDLDHDEIDGFDEVIWSSDVQLIVDDEMHDILVRKIPEGCNLTVVYDCCSSGTGLDLPMFPESDNIFSSEDPPLANANPKPNIIPGPFLPSSSIYDEPDALSPGYDHIETMPWHDLRDRSRRNDSRAGRVPSVKRKHSSGKVIMWSACRDHEKSGEVSLFATGQVRGGLTHAFIESFSNEIFKNRPTYHQLFKCLRQNIKDYNLKQNVLLSSSYVLKTDTRVHL